MGCLVKNYKYRTGHASRYNFHNSPHRYDAHVSVCVISRKYTYLQINLFSPDTYIFTLFHFSQIINGTLFLYVFTFSEAIYSACFEQVLEHRLFFTVLFPQGAMYWMRAYTYELISNLGYITYIL